MKRKSWFFQLFGTDNIAYVCLLLCGIFVVIFYGIKKEVPIASEPIKIGYIGDSITQGTGNFRTAIDVEVGVLGRDYEAINHGVGGATSKDWQPDRSLYNTVIADLKARHARVASIMLGTNDARDDIATSPEAYKKNLAMLVSSLLTSGTIQQVIINYPPYAVPGSRGLWGAQSPQRLTAYMAQLDTLVDGKRVLKGDTESYHYFEAHQNELVDGIHPNGEGYSQLGKLWAKAYITATAKPFIGVAPPLISVRRSS